MFFHNLTKHFVWKLQLRDLSGFFVEILDLTVVLLKKLRFFLDLKFKNLFQLHNLKIHSITILTIMTLIVNF